MQGTYSSKIKEKIAAKAGLTQDGIDWCLEVLDPFPDYAQRLVGECDTYQSKTVPRKPKKSFTISKPASVTSATWDVLIVTSSNLLPPTLTTYDNHSQTTVPVAVIQNGRITVPNSESEYPLNFVTAYAAPSGSDMWPTSGSWTETHDDRFFGVSFEEFAQDRVRMIGGAIEVTNDTPALYMGGHLYTADVSSSFIDQVSNVFRFDEQNLQSQMQTTVMAAPPATAAQMKLLPGCISYAASEGSYAVLRRAKMENPFKPSLPKILMYVASSDIATNQITTSGHADYGVCNPGYWTVDATGNTNLPYQLGVNLCPTNVVPFDMKVILITGLLPEATFTVDVNIIIESIPDSGDVKDQSLASASPNYDPAALELLSHVLNELPPGVPVAQNASGDWFKTVAQGLEDWAPVVGNALGMFGVPGASMIGSAVGKAGKWAVDKGIDKMLVKSNALKAKAAAKATADAEKRKAKADNANKQKKQQAPVPLPRKRK